MMKKMGLILGVTTMLLAGMLFPVGEVAASDSLCDSSVSNELKEQAGCNLSKNDTAPSVIQALINVAVGVIGIGAVAAIIYGGFIYTTSTGDAGKVAKGKNIIIYGIVGLVVAILAFAIVNFVSTSIGG